MKISNPIFKDLNQFNLFTKGKISKFFNQTRDSKNTKVLQEKKKTGIFF